MPAEITLVARLATSAVDSRRGVVRLHPEVLDALDLRPWHAVTLTGSRITTALAAAADPATPHGQVTVDDVTLSNCGLTDGASVVVAPAAAAAARRVVLGGSRIARTATPETIRLALLGKVLVRGDAVSLLPQDLAPPPGSDVPTARRTLANTVGGGWTSELLVVAETEPAGVVAVQPSTVVGWLDGPTTGAPAAAGTPTVRTVSAPVAAPAPPAEPALGIDELVGNVDRAKRLVEWLELTFRRPELLAKLGGTAQLGALVVGPEGVGKATLARSAAAAVEAGCVELDAPSAAALEPGAASQRVHDAVESAVGAARAGRPTVLLVTDVHALLPAAEPPPLATLVLDVLRNALATPGVALVATTSAPEAVDPRLRAPDLVDRELSLALPDARTRTDLLRRLLASVPLAEGVDLAAVAERAPGFVVADLLAVRREAAIRAALRTGSDAASEPRIRQEDLLDAVSSVRPVSMSSSETLQTGGIGLDDVGDMTEVKQALTEAVLWPLQYPDSFARLGVAAPRGVLLYGPPGCGKTFLLRALAGTGRLNVLSVKGAELLDKYVGESERAVRELFRKASDAAPALIFLDEVDALAPRRGGSTDSGVADRVVAALLTELDGAQPLREVIVVGATNRPELIDPALLRPGRLERLVYVPPPDAEARADILRAAGKNTPLADDVDLDELGAELEGYSAADCAAVLREAALTAMRESLEATQVTAAHIEAARKAVPPSLDPAQLVELEAYASRRP
ncbi:MAG: AAA family ATPase [Pseudonocardia sp.]|uniref:AAA family ATPase n=1 Tax=unclassified Pseudonocardia TaxID=2619320 RepID=UPI00086C46AE|nr:MULTISPECIES: AAA family ATPase [unclassified Pseudonocardia]MBN9109081.1 AAA family ATPase [Pseudonocardia sp.]ODV02542.1 MAG: ATPase [Pseudonocardia sp. SCN 73-27]